MHTTPPASSSKGPRIKGQEELIGTAEKCRVLLRLKPLPQVDDGDSPYAVSNNTQVDVSNKENIKIENDNNTFNFDHIFDPNVQQKDLFEFVMKDSVDSVLNGFNATVLAYGQTGAGKTYTMFGGEGEKQGIIPRALEEIFRRISRDDSGGHFVVKASMLEVYMEELKDLLKPGRCKLKLRESMFEGVWVEGMHQAYIPNEQVAIDLLEQGMAARTTGNTNMNAHSSRSHAIFTLHVEQTSPNGFIQRGQLHFADLAGLERVDKTGAQGQTLEEAKRINLSLSALGNCIYALSQAGRSHIPFRDSKLTFFLKNSLGGNAKTTLLINASSRWKDLDETISALKFGARARAIKNVVKVNRKLSAEELERLLNKLKQEHDTLQKYCLSLEKRLTISGSPEDKETIKAGRKSMMIKRADDEIQTADSETAGSPSESSQTESSPTSRAASDEDLPSPVRNLDPMQLLRRISELESANVDMQIELESLAMEQKVLSPSAVVRTSLPGDGIRGNSPDEVPSTVCKKIPDVEASGLEFSLCEIALKPAISTNDVASSPLALDWTSLGLARSMQTSPMTVAPPAEDRSFQTSPLALELDVDSGEQSILAARKEISCQYDAPGHQDWQIEQEPAKPKASSPLCSKMHKKGRWIPMSDKPVTCWLRDSALVYRLDGSKHLAKEIPLTSVSSVVPLAKQGEHGFKIITGGRELTFFTNTAEVNREWLSRLEQGRKA